ncbi:restriction endonuclease subunit S [Streptomyces sp. NPDC092903]|uniref:restriction endonuclease subunit S n=1 Tax=Streptomyces sp. NPDC092903 TaxID=3366017 RepID=UPI0037F4816E
MFEANSVVFRDLLSTTKDGDWGKGGLQEGYAPVHVIRGTDFSEVRRGRTTGVPLRYLAEKTMHRRMLRSGDILIETAGGSRDRPTGRTVLITQEILDAFPGDVTCASFARFLRVDPLVASPQYVYWYLQYLYTRGDMWNHQVQHTGVARFQYTRFADVQEIPLPGRSEQDAIAGTLGVLDEKITVNGRIATTTDRLASSIFSTMMAGCPAPEEATLGEVAMVNSNSIKPASSGSLRYIDISSVGVGSYGWPDRIAWGDAPGRARRAAPVGSTVWSTVRPNRRSHALVLDEDPDLVFSTGLAVLTPQSVGPAFLYEATRTAEFQTYLESVAEGSAYPAVRAERFKEAPLLLPNSMERNRFEEAVMAMRQRAHHAAVESRKLASLRDTLLPQLMSGHLRSKDAEKIVEDHT